MPTKLRDGLAIGLFVVLAGYVGFSGIRLGLLLIDRALRLSRSLQRLHSPV